MIFVRQWESRDQVPAPKSGKKSVTVPNLSLTVKETLQRYSQGNLYGIVNKPVSYSSDDPSFSESVHIGLDRSDPITSLLELRQHVANVSNDFKKASALKKASNKKPNEEQKQAEPIEKPIE